MATTHVLPDYPDSTTYVKYSTTNNGVVPVNIQISPAQSARATRFLQYCPGSLRLDLMATLRLWRERHGAGGSAVDALTRRLQQTLADDDCDAGRRADLQKLLWALQAHRTAAVALANSLSEGVG